jgi:hypothetical protein
MKAALERLERLEEQNRKLTEELRDLRRQLAEARPAEPEAAAPAPIPERVEVVERRVEEQAQTKLESEHRFPIQLTGMLLFNAYYNGSHAGDSAFPTSASQTSAPGLGGATFRQSALGLRFQGPSIFAGGRVGGSLMMDFYAGTGTALNQAVRLRTANVDLDWKSTTLTFAHDKPILSPRDPDSLAQVGVSPLTQAGNLWIWMPQVKLEQRFHFGESAGLRAQGGVFMTNESTTAVPTDYLSSLSRARPGLQGRFELWKEFTGGPRIEIAPGFHVSNSQVDQQSIPSRVYSVDWLIRPLPRIDVTGMWFTGENTNTISGLRPGITYFPDGRIRGVHGMGGWGQLTVRATSRATFHFYGGQQSNRAADLLRGSITRNQGWAGNLMYKVAANVIAAFEVYQMRTTYLGAGTRLVPHYDLSLAYLF